MYRDSRRLRLVLALLIVSSFTLITVDYRAGQGTSLRWLRTAAATVFGPLERAVTSVVRPIGNALATLGDLGGLHDEAARLRAENGDLREQLRQTDDLRREAANLQRMLELAGRGQYKIAAARIVAVGPGNFEWTATVDVGHSDGVRPGQTLLNGDGLVGRVLDVGPYTSNVLLAADPTFTVAARMARTGEIGEVTGRGLRPMRLELLDADAKVVPGEPVVSLGIAGGIVPGVPIGIATRTERSRGSLIVEVQPFVRFTALDVVGVVVEPPRRDPRNAVLPPAPPSPRPSPAGTPPGTTPGTTSPGTTPPGTTPPGTNPSSGSPAPGSSGSPSPGAPRSSGVPPSPAAPPPPGGRSLPGPATPAPSG